MDKYIEIGDEERKPFIGVVGCYNCILGEGVIRLLGNDPRFLLLGVFSYCDSFINSFEENNLDFCIVDTFFLKCLTNGMMPKEKSSDCKILLIEDILLTPEELHSLIISTHVSGILYKDTDGKKLKKALFKVLSGELWLKQDTYESLYKKAQEIIESKVVFRKLLTRAETNVADLTCQGLKNKEIAKKLYISESTVKTHLNNIYKKLNVRNRAQLIRHYLGQE